MKAIDRLAPNLNSLSGETTLVYQDKAREVAAKGVKIINFGIGQPDVPTPAVAREEAKLALDQGFTGYTPALGIDELREAIANDLRERLKTDVKKDEVIVTPGAKASLFLAMASFVGQGDEVLLFDPAFYSYAEVTRLLGGRPVYAKLKREPNSGFHLDMHEVEAKLSPRTKIIVLNNPSNPTAALMNRREVEALSEIARERGIVLLSDEIYDHFVYEGEMASALNESSWRDYLLYVNGFSKTFSMTGWRLGYVVADKQVISKMGTLAANTYTCANSFAQRGALAAFRAKGEVQQMVDLFKRRRDVQYTELSKIKGVNLDLPHATFYAFLDVSKVLETAGLSVKKFSIDLIEKKGVVTIPGEVFPEEVGRMFVRLSFALGEDKIREGVKRLAEFVEEKLG